MKISGFGRELVLFEASKKGKQKQISTIKNDNKSDDYLMDIMDMSKLENLHSFRKISQERFMQYDSYDGIAEDIVISSALEMYADDSCQYDAEGNIIWIEAEDKKVKEFAENILDVTDMHRKIWSVAYSTGKYGDQYIELFTQEEIDKLSEGVEYREKETTSNSEKVVSSYDIGSSAKLETLKITEEGTEETKSKNEKGKLLETIDICDNPESIFDLQEFGKTVGFVRVEKNKKTQQEEIKTYPPTKFVHMYLERPSSRKRDIFEAKYRNEETGKVEEKEFKVVRGKSMIHDIYQIQQIIQLLEDSLILNRLSKSSIIRLLSVEVGDMPRGEVRKLLQRIKSKLEQKINMNTDTGVYGSHSSPAPIDNMVFLPTRGGKGAIQHDSVGGDVDVRSIVDIDYFVNKKFGGLKIPKQYLGFDEANPGMGSGLSLTKMDARYGRTIKRLQTAIIRGITTLINYYLIDRGMPNSINEFQVRMVTPSTVEDSEREEMLQNRIQITSAFLMLFNDLGDVVDKEKMINFVADYIMREPAVKDMIDKEKLLKDKEETDETDEF